MWAAIVQRQSELLCAVSLHAGICLEKQSCTTQKSHDTPKALHLLARAALEACMQTGMDRLKACSLQLHYAMKKSRHKSGGDSLSVSHW